MNKYKSSAITGLKILFSFCVTSSVYCQEVIKEPFSAEFGKPVINYGQIISATIFVVAIIIIALFLIKKLRFNTVASQGLVEIIHSYPVTSKDKLLIIKAGSSYLLLGTSSSGIRKLHVLDKEDIHNITSEENVKTNEFANIFVNLMSKNRHA
jgi:flagellar biogenesis protein FliO